MKRIHLLVILASASLLVAPATVQAAAPATAPMTIVSEGFETASTAYTLRQLNELVPPPDASWGRSTDRKASGSYGLWCARTGYNTWPTYSYYSAGLATFPLPQSADLYLSTLSFSYTMPSLGVADGMSFNVRWNATADPTTNAPHAGFSLTSLGAFRRVSYDMTPTVNLSRAAGSVVFQWVDNPNETPLQAGVGEGPTIDDVLITGWRYGPVRGLSAGAGDSGVTLQWQRPYRAIGSTSLEERAVAYRVWRAPASTEDWVELTVDRVADDGVTGRFVDSTAVRGVSYRYLVQAWEPGTGVGYGQTSEITVAVPAAPTGSVVSPTAGTVLVGSSATIQGVAAAKGGASVTSVGVRVRRDDGLYWNGSAWQAAELLLPATTADAYAHWSATWNLPAGENRSRLYTISARVVDSKGVGFNTSPVSVRVDNVGPRVMVVRRLSATRLLVFFTEPLARASVSAGDFRVTGVRSLLTSVSADGRRVTVLTSRPRTTASQYLTMTAGDVSDLSGNTNPTPRPAPVR